MRTRHAALRKQVVLFAGVLCAGGAHGQRLQLGRTAPPELGASSVLASAAGDLRAEAESRMGRLAQLESAGAGRDRVVAERVMIAARRAAASLCEAGSADARAGRAGLTLARGLGDVDAMCEAHAHLGTRLARGESAGAAERVRWARGRELLAALSESLESTAEAANAGDAAGALDSLAAGAGHLEQAAWAVEGLDAPQPSDAARARIGSMDLQRLCEELRSMGLSDAAAEALAALAPEVARDAAMRGGGREAGSPVMLLRDVLGLVAEIGEGDRLRTDARAAVVEYLESVLGGIATGPEGLAAFWREAPAMAHVARVGSMERSLALEGAAGADGDAIFEGVAVQLADPGGHPRLENSAGIIARALTVLAERRGLPGWRDAPAGIRVAQRELERAVDDLEAEVLEELAELAGSVTGTVSPATVSLLVRHTDAVDSLRCVVEAEAMAAELGSTGGESGRVLAQRVIALRDGLREASGALAGAEALLRICRSVEGSAALPGEDLVVRGDPVLDELCGGRSDEVARILRRDRGLLYQALAEPAGMGAGAGVDSASRVIGLHKRLLGAMLVARQLRDEGAMRRLALAPAFEASPEAVAAVLGSVEGPIRSAVQAMIDGDVAGEEASLRAWDDLSPPALLIAGLSAEAPVLESSAPACAVLARELRGDRAWWTPAGANDAEVAEVSRWLAELAHANQAGAAGVADEVFAYLQVRCERVLFELESARSAGDDRTPSGTRFELPAGVDELMP